MKRLIVTIAATALIAGLSACTPEQVATVVDYATANVPAPATLPTVIPAATDIAIECIPPVGTVGFVAAVGTTQECPTPFVPPAPPTIVVVACDTGTVGCP